VIGAIGIFMNILKFHAPEIIILLRYTLKNKPHLESSPWSASWRTEFGSKFRHRGKV